MEVDQISILEFIYEKDTSSQWVSQILSMGSRKCSKQCTDFQLVYSLATLVALVAISVWACVHLRK